MKPANAILHHGNTMHVAKLKTIIIITATKNVIGFLFYCLTNKNTYNL
jgi:hypothetical protein